MWTRKELKDKAKVSFRANYWKTVLVALIVMAISGWAFSGSSIANTTYSVPPQNPEAVYYSDTPDNVNVDIHDGKITVDVDDEGGKVHVDLDAEDSEELAGIIGSIVQESNNDSTAHVFMPGIALAGFSIGLVVLLVVAITLALYAFVFNPVEVGCQRFFVRNLNQRAEVKEIAYGYDNNYLETVKTLFLRDLFIFLWALLLIVPGIYKSYEYRMIPYLMADDASMTKERAFAESKRMMDGHKWNTFVLDLSFLGWNILSALTLGILGVFYVNPYQQQTNAALYEKLRYGLPAPQPAPQQSAPYAPQWQNPPYGTAAAQPATTAPAGIDPTQSAATVPVAAVAVASEQAATAPVIASTAQPPIPPFAAVGYEPDEAADALSEDDDYPAVDDALADTTEEPVEPTETPAEETEEIAVAANESAAEPNATDSPEA